MNEEFYCTSCGGTDLIAGAYSNWDVAEQRFVLHSVDDENDYCNDCSKRVFGEFREVTNVKTLALLAIHKEGTRCPKSFTAPTVVAPT